MNDKQFPNPETKLNVIRRYLHVLAFLQNNKDPRDWNASTLAELIAIDEPDRDLSDKTVRDYVRKNLKEEMELEISTARGSRRMELSEQPDGSLLRKIIGVYSSFVISDTSRDDVLENFIRKRPYDCLWMLASIYFASLTKKLIEFDYTTNSGYKLKNCLACPYHTVIRNNNLYLLARLTEKDAPWLFIAGRIDNLKVTERDFSDTVPSIDEIFKDSLGSFLGEKYNVKLRFDSGLRTVMEQTLGILDPDIRDMGNGSCTATFTVTDDRYLCKQLFLYGKRVEIIEPRELRELMIDMLKDSITAYNNFI